MADLVIGPLNKLSRVIKYNYCGPGTKLGERIAFDDPNYRNPINNLDSICQQRDIGYSNAASLADKHKTNDLMLERISQIPYMQRPWEDNNCPCRRIGNKISRSKTHHV